MLLLFLLYTIQYLFDYYLMLFNKQYVFITYDLLLCYVIYAIRDVCILFCLDLNWTTWF